MRFGKDLDANEAAESFLTILCQMRYDTFEFTSGKMLIFLPQIIIQGIIQKLTGYTLRDDLDILARINNMEMNPDHVTIEGDHIYFEMRHKLNHDYRVLCRANMHTITCVRDGIEVFWNADGKKASANWETFMAAKTAGAIPQLLANCHRKMDVRNIWQILHDATDPFGTPDWHP